MREQFKRTTKKIRGDKMRKFVLISTIAVFMVLAMATMAFANHNPASKNTSGTSDYNASAYNPNFGVDNWGDRDRTPWGTYSGSGVTCSNCHGSEMATVAAGGTVALTAGKTGEPVPGNHAGRGPHGGYTAATDNCQTCHRVHMADNDRFLPSKGETVVSVCNYCHDLTGSTQGPYNMLGYTLSNGVKAAHRIAGLSVYSGENGDNGTPDNNNSGGTAFSYAPTLANWTPGTGSNWVAAVDGAYNVIPGGSPTTGGNVAINGAGQGELSGVNFTCDSCHTPHAVKGSAVIPYLGDSHIKTSEYELYTMAATSTDAPSNVSLFAYNATDDRLEYATYTLTNRLLKAKNMNGNNVAGNKYGSAWCLACHQGRDGAMGDKFNHPVNEAADGYLYLDAATVATINGVITPDIPSVNTDDAVLKFTALIDPDQVLGAADAADDDYKYYSGRSPYFNQVKPNLVIPADFRSNKMYALTPASAPDIDPITLEEFEDGSMSYEAAAAAGGPSCQQCHGNKRDVEKAFAGDGHPHNQTFPHISANKALLTETGDDFCTNCHGLALP